MIEFTFSEAVIRQGRRVMLVFLLSLIPFLVAFALYFSDFGVERALASVGVVVLISVIIWVIEMPLISWRQRKLKVFVGEDKLIKQCGRKQQILSWTDIVAVTITRNKKELTAQIRLQAKKPKTSLHLHGFRDMEDMANLIRERTSDSVVFREKRWRFNWHNPFVITLFGGVPGMVMMFIVASMGDRAMDVFAILCILSLGAGLLIFRPFTKLDIGYKWVEAAFVVLCLVLGIYSLICFLQTGELP